MRASKRMIAVAAVGLPLLIGAPALAIAEDGGHSKPQGGHSKPHKPQSKPHSKPKPHGTSQAPLVEQDQDAANTNHQENSNASPIYQLSVGGGGDQNALQFNDQDNENWTEQHQEEDVEG